MALHTSLSKGRVLGLDTPRREQSLSVLSIIRTYPHKCSSWSGSWLNSTAVALSHWNLTKSTHQEKHQLGKTEMDNRSLQTLYGGILWVDLYSPPTTKKKDKVLTPSTSECKLTWIKVLYIGKVKVKMRGILGVLNQDPHPRETWRQRDTQVQDSLVTGVRQKPRNSTATVSWQTSEARRGIEGFSPRSVRESVALTVA